MTIYSPSTALAGYANYSSCQSILGYPTYCDRCGDGVIGPLEECEHSIANDDSAWPWNINLRAGCTNNCKRQAGFACDNNIPSTCRYCRNYTTASDEDQFFCNDWNLVNGDGCSDKCLVEQGWTCTIDTSIPTQDDDIFSYCVRDHLGNFHIDTYYHEQCDEGLSTSTVSPNYASGGCYNGWLTEDYICNSRNG